MTDTQEDKVSSDTMQDEAGKVENANNQINNEGKSPSAEATAAANKPQEVDKKPFQEENDKAVSSSIVERNEADENGKAEGRQIEILENNLPKKAASQSSASQEKVENGHPEMNKTSTDTETLPQDKSIENVESGKVANNVDYDVTEKPAENTESKETTNVESVLEEQTNEDQIAVNRKPEDKAKQDSGSVETNVEVGKQSESQGMIETYESTEVSVADKSDRPSKQIYKEEESDSILVNSKFDMSQETTKNSDISPIKTKSNTEPEPESKPQETSPHKIVDTDPKSGQGIESQSVRSDQNISKQIRTESKDRQEITNESQEKIKFGDDHGILAIEESDAIVVEGQEDQIVTQSQERLHQDSENKIVLEETMTPKDVVLTSETGSQQTIIANQTTTDSKKDDVVLSSTDDPELEKTHEMQTVPLKIASSAASHAPPEGSVIMTTTTYLRSMRNSMDSQNRSDDYEDHVKEYVSFIVESAAAVLKTAQEPNTTQDTESKLSASESRPTADEDKVDTAMPAADEDKVDTAMPAADEDKVDTAMPAADEVKVDTAMPAADEDKDAVAMPVADEESKKSPKKKKKKVSDKGKLPPLMFHRPCKFEPHSTQSSYLCYPPIAHLPYYPKLAFPRKWDVPLLPAEPRTVLVGFTCPPAPKFRQDQLYTHSASTLRRYYSKPCIKAIEWIKVSGKR